MQILKKINSYREALTGILVALLLWLGAPTVIRWIDPTAVRFDSVYLHALTYGAIGLMFGGAVTMFFMALFWSLLDKFSDGSDPEFSFNTSFKKCTNYQKILVILWVFFASLLCFVLLVMSINNGLIQG